MISAPTLPILAGSQLAAPKLASMRWIHQQSPSILSCYPQIARAHRTIRPCLVANRSPQPLQSELRTPGPLANSP